MRALSSHPQVQAFFQKSHLGFHFWTFIFVHFSKPNSLFGKELQGIYIIL
jgi:hypothetical protein